MKLGAHVSAAKGLHLVFERSHALGGECVQLFTRAPSQWQAKPLTNQQIEEFRAAKIVYQMPAFVHDIYLTNLAGEDSVRERSIESLVAEVGRCHQLGVDGLVCHLGSHPIEFEGLGRLARGLGQVLDQTQAQPVEILLETTAGQGSCLGHRLEHLQYCLEKNQHHPRLGVCLDSCHATAAGYNLDSVAAVQQYLQEFDQRVGLPRLKLLHLNDSKRECGSRVDRHQHIGEGFVGKVGFWALLHHPGLKDCCAVIETPQMETHHRLNLACLKELRHLAKV